MCGIAGCVLKNNCKQTCLNMLKCLEYRGYDSAGICTLQNGDFWLKKCVGGVQDLMNLVNQNPGPSNCHVAISHTRWATHGSVSAQNAHPHISNNWAIVHNGIIENYQQLKNQYSIECKSQTDSEVLAHLLDREGGFDIFSLIDACKKIDGSYAALCICKKNNKLFLAKNKSPLYVAQGGQGVFVASDVVAFAQHAQNFYALSDGEFAEINDKTITFYNSSGNVIKKSTQKIAAICDEQKKLGFKHYMLKEIYEIPQKIKDIYSYYSSQNFQAFKFASQKQIKKAKNIFLIGCGTAYHSALVGGKFIQRSTQKNVKVFLASEFDWQQGRISKNSVCIFVSQSGETADTLLCANKAKQFGCPTIAITNVLHSTLANMCDYSLSICAGTEIAVASTKAYVCQIILMQMLARAMKNNSPNSLAKFFQKRLQILSQNIKKDIAQNNGKCKQLAKNILKYKKVIFIGKGMDYFTAQEASLKYKEITYIPSQAIPSGELKHGSLAIVDSKTLVVQIATSKKDIKKNQNTAQEVIARGGVVISCSPWKICGKTNLVLRKTKPCNYPIHSAVVFQLLAYHASVMLGNTPDKPRNLAKSVTVE